MVEHGQFAQVPLQQTSVHTDCALGLYLQQHFVLYSTIFQPGGKKALR